MLGLDGIISLVKFSVLMVYSLSVSFSSGLVSVSECQNEVGLGFVVGRLRMREVLKL